MAKQDPKVSGRAGSGASGAADTPTVRLTCLSPFSGPEGAFVAGDTVTVTGDTEDAAQDRAGYLVSTLHVARRLPGEAP